MIFSGLLAVTRMIGGFILIVCLSSCATRNFTKPYSQLVSEAKQRGTTLPSASQERERFFASQLYHQQKLEEFIANRSAKGIKPGAYLLGAGDEIQLKSPEPELNLTIGIPESGPVEIPVVGEVKVNGYTVSQFTKALHAKLRQYIRNPKVSVLVTKYKSQQVTVIGAVKKPGRYALEKGTNSLLEVLGLAGGLTDNAANYVSLVPKEQKEKLGLSEEMKPSPDILGQALEVPTTDLFGTSGNAPLSISIIGGDLVIVPEAGTVLVDGEVQKRGVFALKRPATLFGALASAGGITYSAKVDEIEVIRKISKSQTARLIVNMEDVLVGKQQDLPLRSGDLVRVPSSEGRRMTQNTFEALSKMINIGVGGSVNLAN